MVNNIYDFRDLTLVATSFDVRDKRSLKHYIKFEVGTKPPKSGKIQLKVGEKP